MGGSRFEGLEQRRALCDEGAEREIYTSGRRRKLVVTLRPFNQRCSNLAVRGEGVGVGVEAELTAAEAADASRTIYTSGRRCRK